MCFNCVLFYDIHVLMICNFLSIENVPTKNYFDMYWYCNIDSKSIDYHIEFEKFNIGRRSGVSTGESRRLCQLCSGWRQIIDASSERLIPARPSPLASISTCCLFPASLAPSLPPLLRSAPLTSSSPLWFFIVLFVGLHRLVCLSLCVTIRPSETGRRNAISHSGMFAVLRATGLAPYALLILFFSSQFTPARWRTSAQSARLGLVEKWIWNNDKD